MARDNKILVGYLETPERLLEAAEKCRDRGFKRLDALMPYPVHGFEEALGLNKSWVPSAAKTMLVTGAFLGFTFALWTSAVDWPVNIGGKPLNSWPAFIPIVFESGVLLAGLTTILSLIVAARLFPAKGLFGRKKLIYDERLTNDRFAILVPAEPNGGPEKIVQFLKECGIDEIEEV